MLKFYRWLFRWAEKQCKKYVNCDLKCPKCKLWFSAADGENWGDTKEGYHWHCNQCGELTHWRTDIFPVAVMFADYPVQIEKSGP